MRCSLYANNVRQFLCIIFWVKNSSWKSLGFLAFLGVQNHVAQFTVEMRVTWQLIENKISNSTDSVPAISKQVLNWQLDIRPECNKKLIYYFIIENLNYKDPLPHLNFWNDISDPLHEKWKNYKRNCCKHSSHKGLADQTTKKGFTCLAPEMSKHP